MVRHDDDAVVVDTARTVLALGDLLVLWDGDSFVLKLGEPMRGSFAHGPGFAPEMWYAASESWVKVPSGRRCSFGHAVIGGPRHSATAAVVGRMPGWHGHPRHHHPVNERFPPWRRYLVDTPSCSEKK